MWDLYIHCISRQEYNDLKILKGCYFPYLCVFFDKKYADLLRLNPQLEEALLTIFAAMTSEKTVGLISSPKSGLDVNEKILLLEKIIKKEGKKDFASLKCLLCELYLKKGDEEKAWSVFTSIKDYSSLTESVKKGLYTIGLKYLESSNSFCDANKAFEIFLECGDYLPALKENFYLCMSNIQDEGPTDYLLYALTQNIAAEIISQEPGFSDARVFLDRKNLTGKSNETYEKFVTKTNKLSATLRIFSDTNSKLFKDMRCFSLFQAKNNSGSERERKEAQQKWDELYGLTVINAPISN